MKEIKAVLPKWHAVFLAAAVLVAPACGEQERDAAPQAEQRAEATLARAWREQVSDIQVRGRGEVVRMLPDDSDGSRHQRFILRLDSGQTLLVSHNIDLAPRVADLELGDTVEFLGEYEWNEKGGVIHWTHHDPAGRHAGGWLRHEGQTYR